MSQQYCRDDVMQGTLWELQEELRNLHAMKLEASLGDDVKLKIEPGQLQWERTKGSRVVSVVVFVIERVKEQQYDDGTTYTGWTLKGGRTHGTCCGGRRMRRSRVCDVTYFVTRTGTKDVIGKRLQAVDRNDWTRLAKGYDQSNGCSAAATAVV